MGDMANMSTWFVYLALFVISLMAAHLLLGMGKWATKVKSSVGKSGNAGSSKSSLFKLLFLLIAAAMVVFFALHFYYYAPLNGEMLTARLNFSPASENKSAYQVQYTPFEGGQPESAKKFTLKGNCFAVEAEVLQWPSLLKKIGFPVMFRLTKLQGYIVVHDEKRSVGEAALAGGGQNSVWQIVQKASQILQLAKTKRLKSDLFFPANGDASEVYVTSAGIRIGKHSQSARPTTPKAANNDEPGKVRYPRKPEDVRH